MKDYHELLAKHILQIKPYTLLQTHRFAFKNQSIENCLKWEIELLKELCFSLISYINKHMSFEGGGQDLTKCKVNHYHKHF